MSYKVLNSNCGPNLNHIYDLTNLIVNTTENSDVENKKITSERLNFLDSSDEKVDKHLKLCFSSLF